MSSGKNGGRVRRGPVGRCRLLLDAQGCQRGICGGPLPVKAEAAERIGAVGHFEEAIPAQQIIELRKQAMWPGQAPSTESGRVESASICRLSGNDREEADDIPPDQVITDLVNVVIQREIRIIGAYMPTIHEP